MHLQYALVEVRRERYLPPEKPLAAVTVRTRRARAFDVYRTIWGPRVKTADSADLYESSLGVLHTRLLDEWLRACQQGALRHINRYDDDADADEDGDGLSDEAQEVSQCAPPIHAARHARRGMRGAAL